MIGSGRPVFSEYGLSLVGKSDEADSLPPMTPSSCSRFELLDGQLLLFLLLLFHELLHQTKRGSQKLVHPATGCQAPIIHTHFSFRILAAMNIILTHV